MRSRSQPARTPATTEELLAELRAARLLSAAQVQRLAEEWPEGDPAERLRELVERELLTAYQAEQVLAGRARRLRLGQYRILERLGAGGMGTVYKAEHRLMKRVVALKVIGRDRAAGAERLREVRATAELAHPNIVSAYDAARARGRLFLVLEYVAGPDLGQLLTRGPLPVPLACAAVRQAALALQCLHERGLVHRDVKPANLVLAAGGEAPLVKLLDLGLARRAGTGRGDLSGTIDYLAPERGMGNVPADGRADLYSLGCTFYHLLTGRVPFPGGTWTEKLLRHRLEAPVPVRALRPEVPAAVAAVVERLMAHDPADRYPSPAAVAEALPAPVSAAPVAPRRGRALPWAVAALSAALVGTLLGVGARLAVAEGTASAPAAAHELPTAIEVRGLSGPFRSLAEAVAAAPDGGVVVLRGPGPFRTAPLSLAGKALTLQAGPGPRPRLERADTEERPWEALLSSDRPLTVRGLSLRAGAAEEQGPGVAPLVCVEGATLFLADCRLESAGRGPLFTLRRGTGLRLENSRLEAEALAASVEVGPERACRVELADCRVHVRNPAGAALSLWSAERHAAVDLRLRGNTITAGRVVACRAPDGPLRIVAVGNRFSFHAGVLSYDGGADPDGWRRRTSWQGQDNRYDGAGAWLRLEGRPGPVRDRAGWRRLWREGRVP
jgi:hypothetical protein